MDKSMAKNDNEKRNVENILTLVDNSPSERS